VLIGEISKYDTTSGHVRIHEKYMGEKPNEDDTVTIKHDNDTIFSGKPHKD